MQPHPSYGSFFHTAGDRSVLCGCGAASRRCGGLIGLPPSTKNSAAVAPPWLPGRLFASGVLTLRVEHFGHCLSTRRSLWTCAKQFSNNEAEQTSSY